MPIRRSSLPAAPPTARAVAPSSGPPWTWHCRQDDRGNDVIDEWHSSELSKKARMNFERRRDHLSQLGLQYWQRPAACSLGDHIYVIHFKDESGKQWRPFGHIDLQRSTFVLTQPAYEKDDVYHPRDASDRAKSHRDTITGDFPRYARACF